MQILFTPVVFLGVLGFLVVLDVVLVVLLSRAIAHYNHLTKGVDQKSLMAVLEGIQRTLATHEKTIGTARGELQKVKEESKSHLQRLKVERFNPFSDTGGDQSFMLAILDGNKDGVVITSLHSRENTRFYVKSVKGGAGTEYPLSAEEQKIIDHRGV